MHPFPAAMMMQGAVSAVPSLKPQDVHATTVYTGTGATRDITVGFRPDLLNFKRRDAGQGHLKFQSTDALNTFLRTNTTDAAVSGYSSKTSLLSTGVRIVGSGDDALNYDGDSMVLWAETQAPKYLQIRTFTHTSGTADTFDMAVLGVVGEVTIKRTDAAGDWYVWHRSLDAGRNLRLNTTAAQSATNAFISVSGTTVMFAAGAPSGAYYLEAWAHDPDPENGIVQCGSGSSGTAVNLGWSPQILQLKRSDAASQWLIWDTVRGWTASASNTLKPNAADAESADGAGNGPTATGFNTTGYFAPGSLLVFRAIRAAY